MSDSKPLPIFDGHNDVLLKLYKAGGTELFFNRNSQGEIDLPRAREGGLAGGFFAVYVPEDLHAKPTAAFSYDLPKPLDPDYSLRMAMGMTALLFRMEAESEGQLKVVRTVSEISACLRDGVMAAILHFEGAEPLDKGLDALEVFYRAGLRSLGPVWSRPNAFGEGVPFGFPNSPDTGPGLTDAGRELIKECNRLGILIDLSHMNEKGFWQIAKLSDAPLVATHSNVHVLCQSPRNLTDRQLDAIKESDGMVGVNFGVGFLREDGGKDPDVPLETIVRHFDYLIGRLGIDRVGFGSDFDGALMPLSIGDATGLPKLVSALRASGYDDASLHKLAHENWLRVLGKTWRD